LPLYEYECTKCGHRFERIEAVGASETKKCPKCGAKAERLLAAPAIQFKGSGWYVTDYAGKNSDSTAKEAGDGAKTEKSDKGEKPAAKPAETKSAEKETSKKKK
jgi:putative FmdB family regulatory protein